MKKQVRLSQCMIVKNEERNIERALSWGKGIVCEQIVVDTGSTDRTVALAEAMGAKVLHFKWIDDFAAAKNFAISHATGNWIAFLDADEYFQKADAQKLLSILSKVEYEFSGDSKPQIVRSRWIQLNDAGIPFADSIQDRIFLNVPDIRYDGQIHENLISKAGDELRVINASDSLEILHTGYSDSAFADTKKALRNVELLKKQLKDCPDNYDAMSYLADALLILGEVEEAETYLRKIITLDEGHMDNVRRISALLHSLKILTNKNNADDISEITSLYHKILLIDPNHPDPHYLVAVWMMNQKRFEEATFHLETGLDNLEHYRGRGLVYMAGDLEHVYLWLAQIYFARKSAQETVRYGTLSLRINKYQATILEAILSLLRDESNQTETPHEVFGFLKKLYDFQQLKDLLFVFKCAKSTSFYRLQEMLFAMLPESEQESLMMRKQQEPSAGEITVPFPLNNMTDRAFLQWVSNIQSASQADICDSLKQRLSDLKKLSPVDYKNYINYYSQYSFWGRLKPDENVYESFENRAREVTSHLNDFIWLYSRLKDYRSKQTLLAILSNWTEFDTSQLSQVREYTPDYFDLDIIPTCKNEIFVDLGAYIGDTLNAFISTYGTDYQKIYCYEITPDITEILRRNAVRHERVEVRQKAVGKEAGTLFLSENTVSSSANTISRDAAIAVNVVAIDDDIPEAVTFIKMDIKGSEQDALQGCRKQIQNNHPKLAISVYHGYEDLWKIPRVIHEISPEYQFYLRHYGGNLIPSEFVLYAV